MTRAAIVAGAAAVIVGLLDTGAGAAAPEKV
jgi:hypothetical protein